MSPSSMAKGGKAVYGAAVGILMLEARFPRIPGDVGNATTWPFPVLYKVVRGASPDRVVRRRAEGLLEALVAGGRELVAEGADHLRHQLRVPVALFGGPRGRMRGAGRNLGADAGPGDRTAAAARQTGRASLTVSAASLEPEHLAAAGVALDTPVVGTEGGRAFSRVLLGDELELDVAAAERDILDAGDALVARHPEVGAVLRNTSTCPYARALRDRLGLPAFDMVGFVTWFHGGLVPRRWPAG